MRLLAAVACIALAMEGCVSGTATPSEPPEASVGPAASASPEAVPSAIATPASLADGRVLFHRTGPDEVERYFTIRTDGTDETAVYERQGCSCAHLSADGKRILTIGETGHGTYSLLTMNLDGTDHVTTDPGIATLNLFIGATS